MHVIHIFLFDIVLLLYFMMITITNSDETVDFHTAYSKCFIHTIAWISFLSTGFCSLSTTVKQAGHTSFGWQVDPSIPSLAVAGETTCWTGNLPAPQWES